MDRVKCTILLGSVNPQRLLRSEMLMLVPILSDSAYRGWIHTHIGLDIVAKLSRQETCFTSCGECLY